MVKENTQEKNPQPWNGDVVHMIETIKEEHGDLTTKCCELAYGIRHH
jgi:hypothetical protein